MISSMKGPSNVMPLDVSGQTFSRMASFRRSLIHVDFFIRRKKKDKRRNTVAEGDTKELKSALQHIINEEQQKVSQNGTLKKSLTDAAPNNRNLENAPKKTNTQQINKKNSLIQENVENEVLWKRNSDPNRNQSLQNGHLRTDVKSGYNTDAGKTSLSIRKPKSHIPISTLSAAMNVAVEMRQLNGIEDQSSSGNWSNSSDHNLSDLDSKKTSDNNSEIDQSTLNGEDSGFSDSYKTHKNRSKSNGKTGTSNVGQENDEPGAISSASSETTAVQDEDESNATSVESDAFFISSDESEDESSDLFAQKYGSSTSISTMSDGSLNSLLSQTGTEMASSTGTLTSIGFERYPTPPTSISCEKYSTPSTSISGEKYPTPPTSVCIERYPTPPPPPPPFVIVASKNEIVTDSTPHYKKSEKLSKRSTVKSPSKQTIIPNTTHKRTLSPKKQRKSLSVNKSDKHKNSDNSKNLFTSLVSKKSREKEQCRPKYAEQNNNSTARNESFFDMYGTNSPQKIPQLPTFIQKHNQTISEIKPKTQLQSFLPVNTNRVPLVVVENKSSAIDNNLNTEDSVPKEYSLPPSIASSDSKTIPPVKNIEVPLKYVQQVVVTPISRQSVDSSNIKYSCRKSLFNDTIDAKQGVESEAHVKLYNSQVSDNINNHTSVNIAGKPQRPNTLQSSIKPAARVVLDPEGRVIYSTNSLDRHTHYEFPKQCSSARNNISNRGISVSPSPENDLNYRYTVYSPPKNDLNNQRYSISSLPRSDAESSNYPLYSRRQNYSLQNTAHNVQSPCDQHSLKSNALKTFATSRPYNDVPRFSECPHNYHNMNQIRHIPSDVIDTDNRVHVNDQQLLDFPPPPEPLAYTKISPPPYEEAINTNCSRILIADPNVSGLPPMETMLTEKNINLHLETIERLNRLQLEPNTNLHQSPINESSPTNNLDIMGSNLSKLRGSTMSTEDLFAVIHDCKKRMNIKTDSDISSSSRSNSPSFLRPPSHKGAYVETGFLSPRSNFNNTRDRRSWADFRPVSSSPNERKSLASDRLGRTKPTSMHDFKMLLLQARSNTQISGPRKSAVEMLKVSPTASTSGGCNNPSITPQYPNSFSLQSSPTSPSYISNGHSTVPFKRHSNRMRSSLQTRYTMYPPIFEDCSEETENSRDAGA